jgi:hypothetical protein
MKDNLEPFISVTFFSKVADFSELTISKTLLKTSDKL